MRREARSLSKPDTGWPVGEPGEVELSCPTMNSPERPAARSIALAAAKFMVPALIIGYLLYSIEPSDWAEIRDQPKSFWMLAAALVVSIAAMTLSFARWCVLVRCQGIELSMLEAFRLGSICFLLSFVSAGSVGGDVFKAIFLAKRRPGKRVEAVASVFVDRGSGLYGLLLLVAGAFLLSEPLGVSAVDAQAAKDQATTMQSIQWATGILIGVGTFVLAVLILGGRSVDRLIAWASQLPVIGGLVTKIGPPLRAFHHHPFAFGLSVLMSLGVQSLLVVSMYLVARGLYQSPPTFAEHFVIVPIGMLASALPITPAGLGVLEATIEWLYRIVPRVATDAKGTLVALVFEFVKVVMAVIGTVFYWTANAEVRESLEDESDADDWVPANPANVATASSGQER